MRDEAHWRMVFSRWVFWFLLVPWVFLEFLYWVMGNPISIWQSRGSFFLGVLAGAEAVRHLYLTGFLVLVPKKHKTVDRRQGT